MTGCASPNLINAKVGGVVNEIVAYLLVETDVSVSLRWVVSLLGGMWV